MYFDQAAAAADNAGGFAVGVAFDATGFAVGNLEILVDAAEFQRQRVEGRIGASTEVDGISRRGSIELGARGKTLIAQARDEHLRENYPVAFFRDGGARMNVLQHVGDGLHVGYWV